MNTDPNVVILFQHETHLSITKSFDRLEVIWDKIQNQIHISVLYIQPRIGLESPYITPYTREDHRDTFPASVENVNKIYSALYKAFNDSQFLFLKWSKNKLISYEDFLQILQQHLIA